MRASMAVDHSCPRLRGARECAVNDGTASTLDELILTNLLVKPIRRRERTLRVRRARYGRGPPGLPLRVRHGWDNDLQRKSIATAPSDVIPSALPPGPALPASLQTVLWLGSPVGFMEWCARR